MDRRNVSEQGFNAPEPPPIRVSSRNGRVALRWVVVVFLVLVIVITVLAYIFLREEVIEGEYRVEGTHSIMPSPSPPGMTPWKSKCHRTETHNHFVFPDGDLDDSAVESGDCEESNED